jgi:spore coat protein A
VIADRTFTPDGQLVYPVSGKKDAPWTPEVFGNAILVNGKLSPFLDVEPRPYRFRILNASNARFYRLSLGEVQPFAVIGSDQGLLPAPVSVKRLPVAPGERFDIVVDFSGLAGSAVLLRSDSFSLMQFRVARGAALEAIPLPSRLRNFSRTPETAAIKTRLLTLGEVDDMVAEPMQMLLNGKHWHDPVSETPVLDSTEIWSLINLTDDSHPIHLHLVRFQILDRRRFDAFAYQTTGKLLFHGDAVPAAPVEAGWKDTARADPKMVTRIIVRFEGYTGRYVWHCHIAEHEDNDMMRPFDVLPAG